MATPTRPLTLSLMEDLPLVARSVSDKIIGKDLRILRLAK
jgi:hypothetical protein